MALIGFFFEITPYTKSAVFKMFLSIIVVKKRGGTRKKFFCQSISRTLIYMFINTLYVSSLMRYVR